MAGRADRRRPGDATKLPASSQRLAAFGAGPAAVLVTACCVPAELHRSYVYVDSEQAARPALDKLLLVSHENVKLSLSLPWYFSFDVLHRQHGAPVRRRNPVPGVGQVTVFLFG
jgi:hypothetical protein